MADIVEQLRSGLDNADGGEMGGVVLTMRQAADEIERLRSLVRFHEEQKKQSEAMREAAMRLAYPGLFPELGGASESKER